MEKKSKMSLQVYKIDYIFKEGFFIPYFLYIDIRRGVEHKAAEGVELENL